MFTVHAAARSAGEELVRASRAHPVVCSLYTLHLHPAPPHPLLYPPPLPPFPFLPATPVTMSAMNIDRALDDIVKENRASRRSTKKPADGAASGASAPSPAPMEGTGARKSRRRRRKSGERGSAAMDAESERMSDTLSRRTAKGSGSIGKKGSRARGGGLSSAAVAAISRAGAMEIERKAAAAAANASKANAGCKIVVHNLHHGVTNGDINDLFSGVGKLQRALVIYDVRGNSTGVAEVVFARRDDALESIKRYNGVPLDNKPLRISLATSDSPTSRAGGGGVSAAGGRAKGKKLAVSVDKTRAAAAAAAAAASSGNGGGSARSSRSSRRRGGGGGGGGSGAGPSSSTRQPREKKAPLTSADLDAQLDSYRMTD